MTRTETLKKLIAEAEKYLNDPEPGKRKAAEGGYRGVGAAVE